MHLRRRLDRIAEAARTGNLHIVARNRLRASRPPLLYRRPTNGTQRWSERRINLLLSGMPGSGRFLEIGVNHGRTFQQVRASRRVGVEPQPLFDPSNLPRGCQIYCGTSDDYFAALDGAEEFDVVFVDGLHTFEQTYRDVLNAFAVCPTGVVVVDDVVPEDEVSAMRSMEASYVERERRGLAGSPWHGDVFRAVLCMIDNHPELEWRTIVGSGNDQLLLWKRDYASSLAAVSPEVLDGYGHRSFGSVFADGVPASFVPVDEATAIADALRSVADRRHRPA